MKWASETSIGFLSFYFSPLTLLCSYAFTLLLSTLFFPVIAFAQPSLETVPLEDIQILKISASDARATIKTPDGALHLFKVGDPLGAAGGIVVEIAEGKVVIEEKEGRDKEKIIFQLEGKHQRIERYRRSGFEQPPANEVVTQDGRRFLRERE